MDRKIGLLALTLALTATLAGCSNSGAEANPTPSAPAVAPTDSPLPTANPGTVSRGNIDGGMWNDDLGRTAGNAARGAVNDAERATRDAINGAGDMARDAANGIEDALRGVGNAAQDVGNGIVNPTW